jgi:two-component system LytT family sensor kinase
LNDVSYLRWKKPSVIVFLCVGAALFLSILIFLPKIFRPETLDLEIVAMIWIQLFSWLIWAAFIPLILAFVRRLRRFHLKPVLLVFAHAAAAVVFVTLHSFATAAAWLVIRPLIIPDPQSAPLDLAKIFDFYLFGMQFLIYGLFLAGILGFEYYSIFKDRELKASRLETSLAQARLEVLKTQIHPHFLFNALNGIAALVTTDPEAAELMIERLSGLLRATLKIDGPAEIRLREEIQTLGLFLDIEEARFKDRLTFNIELDQGTEDALVPAFLLQPLVENAVRHGVAPLRNGGTVDVRARREGDRLILEIADDGPGFPGDPAASMNRGLGLGNTRARLELLYGAAGILKLENPAGGGARVEIRLPFRTEPASNHA